MLIRLIKNILLIVLGTAMVVVGYQTFFRPQPCEAPIRYKIGEVDSRFGVSQAQLLKDLEQAGGLWSDAISRELFRYDPKGSLTINLMYDERQKATQQEKVLKTKINETKVTATTAKEEYTSLQAQYVKANAAYAVLVAELKQAQDAYNTRVKYWNTRGGAPKADFESLQLEKAALSAKQKALEAKRLEVNQLADSTNALIDKYNLLINHINTHVTAINNDGFAGTEFEEGVYVSDSSGQRIDIFQFENQATFIRVLAHELGHALDIGHNPNPDSIMHAINNSHSVALSPEDIVDLQTACRL